MQMSLSGFLTFIYPHAERYGRVENCKSTSTNTIEPDTENEKKKNQSKMSSMS